MILKKIFFIISLLSAENCFAQHGYHAVSIDTVKVSGYVVLPVGKSFMLFVPDDYLLNRSLPDYIDWYNKTFFQKLVDSNMFVFILDKNETNPFVHNSLLRTTQNSTMFSDYYKVNAAFKRMIDSSDFSPPFWTGSGVKKVYKDRKYKNVYYEIFRIEDEEWIKFKFLTESFDLTDLPYNFISPDPKNKYINLYIFSPDKRSYFSPIYDLKNKRFKLVELR
ncbi:MAG TPA: hypothetical protein VLZ83_05360 [Edaphocola sp.]|nr:hypothetical protein [Edaphocola sp.]